MNLSGLPRIDATVGVTGMNATDNPAPGVGVVRALRHEPSFAGRVVGLGYDTLDPGFYTKGLLDAGAILPFPTVGREVFLARMRELRARFSVDLLIPTLDSELRAVASLEADLGALGIRTFVPDVEMIDRASKPRLARLGEAAGFPVPESQTIVSEDAIPEVVRRFGLPLVVKGVYYGAWIAQSESDATAAFHHFVAAWGVPVIIQRFIDGDEYNICAVGDGEGGTIGAVAMRKMALTDKGKGWAGVTVDDPLLLALTETVIGSLRWRGPIEIEVLVDKKGSDAGDVYVVEINPRFPAWVYLTAAAGLNLPYLCAVLALGLSVPQTLARPKVGTMFVRVSLDQIADLDTYAQLTSTGLLIRPSGELA